MLKYTLSLAVILYLFSCTEWPAERTEQAAATPVERIIPQNDTFPEQALWADPYIQAYLDANKDRLKEVDGFPLCYIKDTQVRNGRNYAVAQIGHSFESRYITDQWIYIDRATKDIYEYDLVNDSLILWAMP